ncbi:MAG: geranylgeranyl reductase family protein [Anaerolineaceae bacterium]|nr:geranylgeranyl reductase family protein [Anaerolineaceae bacterium]
MPETEVDVIIVGAGPAGATCARLLGRQGHSVVMIDRAKFPRKKSCGGWVSVKAFSEFPELEKLRKKSGPRNRLVEETLHGLVFHNADMTREAVFSARRTVGYTVLRETFDAQLVELAKATSRRVTMAERCRVTGIDVGEQGVSIRAGGRRRFRGRILVGADGIDSTVARLTGLRDGWPLHRKVACLAKEVAVDPRTLNRLYGKQRKIHLAMQYGGTAGYAWAFPKRNTVGIGVGCRADQAADIKALYGDWVGDLCRAGLLPEKADLRRPVGTMEPAGGAIDYEGHVGKRTLLIGDAGGFVSAATGEGIYPAMLSARVAARCIGAALQSAHPQDALLEFKFAWRRAFVEYIQMPNANLAFLLPLIYDNQELCRRLAHCYLFGENF